MPPSKILVDSSFLIALYDRDADEYDAVKEIAKLHRGRFLVPQVVLTEVVYLLKRETGVQGTVQFLEEFNDSQPDLQDVTVDDLKRVQEIMQQYASARLDFVDCSIMHFLNGLTSLRSVRSTSGISLSFVQNTVTILNCCHKPS